MRRWLKINKYINAPISGDNEDPTFSSKINRAKKMKKNINYDAVQKLFLDHVITSLECNDNLAIEHLGRSPKHMLLLHEVDATVMYIKPLVKRLRKKGWKIINASDVYSDPIYSVSPKSTYSGYGIVGQIAHEKSGKKHSCYDYKKITSELNRVLNL